MAGLVLKGIKKSFGDVNIIHGVDLEIQDGEFVVFVGPSGCGKSTLLRCIAGLEDITSGDLSIGDKRVNDEPPSKRGVAMVFQSYALYPHMTVAENMAFALKLANASKDEQKAAVDRAAKILQIEPLLERKPKALSGGQRQRVAIGRAIVRKPEVFLFDEPLSNLDAALRVQMRVELSKLHRELKSTMIYVTHDQVEAMTLANRIVVLSAGRIEQVGAPLDLYHRPANIFVAGFIGSPKMNFFNATVSAEGDAVTFAGGVVAPAPFAKGAARSGAALTIGIRPEHFERGSAADASLDATVDFVEHLGGTSFVHGHVSTGEKIIAERRAVAGVKAQQSLHLGFTMADARAFDADGARIR